MKRENFQSRLGFLLVSAGCAIGIGNVWKFPYVTGENGGGVFVLFYLLFLILMGITLALCLTVLGIWLHEDSLHATAFAAVDGELFCLDSDGRPIALTGSTGTPSSSRTAPSGTQSVCVPGMRHRIRMPRRSTVGVTTRTIGSRTPSAFRTVVPSWRGTPM